MTSRRTTNTFSNLTKDEILYHYYSYDGLQYTIDILKGFYETYRNKGQGKDPLFDKKCSIIKFEIVANFCHYAEVLAAFLYPCHNLRPSFYSADILENLSKYTVKQIDQFYEDLNDGYGLDNAKRDNYKYIFGYSRIKPVEGSHQMINSSLSNIIEVLKAIAEFYNFWRNSYNAYKHGYRLWFGDKQQEEQNVVVFLKKYNKLADQPKLDALPIDDETINDVHNFSKYCRSVFDIIFDNNRELMSAVNTSSKAIEFSFLEFKEPKTKIDKKWYAIE